MQRVISRSAAEVTRMHLAVLAAALLLAAAEALAQNQQAGVAAQERPCPARRIAVGIPDRMLALNDDGRVLRAYPVAVDTDLSPSPAGEFRIDRRLTNPTCYAPGVVIPPGSVEIAQSAEEGRTWKTS